jgi:hypothetical protein
MADEEERKFAVVAIALGDRLLREGFGSLPLRIKQSDSDGWHSKVASWANHRPEISVWYDNWLEDPVAKHFWFGFEGSKEKINSLRHEAEKCGLDRPVRYNNLQFEGVFGKPVDIVHDYNGFVYEKYRGAPSHLGPS